MATNALRTGLVEMMRELQELRRSDASRMREWCQVLADGEQPAYWESVRGSDWGGLAVRARAELQARRDDLREMGRRQDRLGGIHARWEAFISSIRSLEIPFVKREDWPSTRSQLERELAGRNLSPEQAARALARLEAADGLRVEAFEVVRCSIRMAVRRLNELADTQLAARMGATLALAVARFNELFASGAAAAMEPSVFCRETDARLEAMEREVWEALRAGRLMEVWAAATDLGYYAASTLILGALPQAAAAALRRRCPEGDTDEAGRLALRLGDLIRALLRAVALGRYVVWLARWPAELPPTRDWVRAAGRLAFPSAYRAPRVVSPGRLAARPGAFNGLFVTVEGRLGRVDVFGTGERTVSAATVTGDDGLAATVVLPGIRLDSGGMARGAYVRISGVWRRDQPDVGRSAMVVARVDLGRLAEASWRDWATSRLRHVFEPVPHGLAAAWSWEPGAEGASSQLRHATWFRPRDGRDR